mmetsp:Transcript_6129/g.13886  ORF Transcript_6129/g.13886 Transcript_6129/m.13886 type:complete len:352 (-) Transcript_6129:1264-2319(-)
MHRQIHTPSMFREQTRMHINTPPTPIIGKFLGQYPHVSHQNHILHTRPRQHCRTLRIILLLRQTLGAHELRRHSDSQALALVQYRRSAAVADDRHDFGVKGSVRTSFHHGKEGCAARGSQHANAELFANGTLGNVRSMVHQAAFGCCILEGDLFDRPVRCGEGLGEVRSRSRDGQHASSGTPCDLVVVHFGTGVVHLDIFRRGNGIQPFDFHSLGIRFGIPLCGADDRGGRNIFLEADVDGCQVSGAACDHDFVEVRLEEGKDYLCFGVAETAVEFEYGGTVGSEHHASIQNTHIRSPPLRHLLHSPHTHFLNLPLQLRRNTRSRSISTHTPRIQPLVPIQRALVILRRGH